MGSDGEDGARSPARRRRRTVCVDAEVFGRVIEDCVQRALRQQRRAGAGGTAARHARDPWLPAAAATPDFLRQHVRAMLKAFVAAARPARGLPLDADGRPQDLPALIAAGHAISLAGHGESRFERNIRAGAPVDLRLAMAALHCCRLLLGQPRLGLDQIGAFEPAQQQATREIGAAVRELHAQLPAQAVGGLLAKAQEAAASAWALTGYVREYRDFRTLVDARGLPRIALTRITRFRPVKLVAYERPFHPSLSYEWHEWNRFVAAQLQLRRLDARGRAAACWTLPLDKRLDEARDLMVYALAPGLPPEAGRLLDELARAVPGQQPLCEFEFVEQLVLNAADRDLVVSYLPITGLQVGFDVGAHPDIRCAVGDAPGLVRDGLRWRLARVLLPREVLAVRLRLASLGPAQALAASPTGEILLPPAAPAMRHTRRSATA